MEVLPLDSSSDDNPGAFRNASNVLRCHSVTAVSTPQSSFRSTYSSTRPQWVSVERANTNETCIAHDRKTVTPRDRATFILGSLLKNPNEPEELDRRERKDRYVHLSTLESIDGADLHIKRVPAARLAPKHLLISSTCAA